MGKRLILAATGLLVGVASADWRLVWSDEFNGTELDASKWGYEQGFIRNSEYQFYTNLPENVRLENGCLVLQGRRVQLKNPDYVPGETNDWKRARAVLAITSGSVNTRHRFAFTYGRVECRAKVPARKGSWPAIWTLGANIGEDGWPKCGEIDILEFYGQMPDKVTCNVHGQSVQTGKHATPGSSELRGKTPADGFHVYAMEWTAQEVVCYYDGIRYGAFPLEAYGDAFEKPHYILLNLALGADWMMPESEVEVDDGTRFEVDWIRVYQKEAPVADDRSGTVSTASSPWKVLPIYGGGYVQNVVIAPSNPDVWYCYVDVGGPYRSDDRGMSWRPLHQNYLPSQTARSAACTRSLSVDPRDADNFVLVSGNQYDRPAGAFVSRDGGRTFRQTLFGRFYGNGPRRPSGLCLARNPSNPDELIAGEDMDGLFLSEDNGETWRLTGPKGHWFSDIKYDQAVPGRVYACASAPLKRIMASARCQRAFKLGRGRKTGFYVSADGGRAWTRLSDDAPAELVQIKGNGDLVGVFSDYREIRISHDGGRTWSDYHQGLPKKADTYFADGGPIPYEYYAFAAGDGFYLVADAAGTLYRRGTADAQWTKVERGAVEWGDPECENTSVLERKRLRKVFECACSIIIDPADPKRWIITDWYHIWQSPNEGRDWTARTRGMMQLVSFDLAFDPFNADNIIYGVADMGMFGTWNGGRTWESPKSHPYVQRLAFSKKTPGVLYAVGTRGETFLFRSDDSGRTWTSLAGKPGLPQPMKEPGPCAFGVEVDPVNDDVYVTVSGPCAPGKGGVYRSHDRGETWEWFSKGLPVDKGLFRDGEWSGDLAWPMVFSPDGSCVLTLPKLREVWYLDRAAGIWRNSGDKSWNNRVVADPFRPGRFIKTGTVMRESTDGGRTWRDNESMPGSCWGLAFDAHVPGLLVLRSEDEMFISEDGGACFYALPQGLAYPHSGQTHVFVDRGRLFAFTGGSGVFTRTLHLKPARHNNQNQGNTQK